VTIILHALLLLALAPLPASGACPVTPGTADLLGPPFPPGEHWFGSEALAVQLPPDGTWPASGSPDRLTAKFVWWSAGYEPGQEDGMTVTVERLGDGPADATASAASNALTAALGGWVMMTGLAFPTPGCFRVHGDFNGQQLSVVVRVEPERDYLLSRRSPLAVAVADAWAGRWTGPEGTWLDLDGSEGSYRLTLRDLDGERSFEAIAAEGGVYFERDGRHLLLRATDGTGTGMKWLADKRECLAVAPGEGWCRD
jgi:hypothetical protein